MCSCSSRTTRCSSARSGSSRSWRRPWLSPAGWIGTRWDAERCAGSPGLPGGGSAEELAVDALVGAAVVLEGRAELHQEVHCLGARDEEARGTEGHVRG